MKSAHELNNRLKKQFPQNGPGAALSITQRGRGIYKNVVGYADIELRVPLTSDMAFRVGSITKQFTAVSILLLAQKGHFCLDEQINDYLTNLPKTTAGITIRQLLSHTSGLPNYTDRKEYQEIILKLYYRSYTEFTATIVITSSYHMSTNFRQMDGAAGLSRFLLYGRNRHSHAIRKPYRKPYCR